MIHEYVALGGGMMTGKGRSKTSENYALQRHFILHKAHEDCLRIEALSER